MDGQIPHHLRNPGMFIPPQIPTSCSLGSKWFQGIRPSTVSQAPLRRQEPRKTLSRRAWPFLLASSAEKNCDGEPNSWRLRQLPLHLQQVTRLWPFPTIQGSNKMSLSETLRPTSDPATKIQKAGEIAQITGMTCRKIHATTQSSLIHFLNSLSIATEPRGQ